MTPLPKRPALWAGARAVVERIRASDVDVIINTTAGMGGDLMLDPHEPTTFVEGTDLVSGVDRLPHVEELLPDICTLDWVDGRLRATAEVLGVHVVGRSSAAFPEDVDARIRAARVEPPEETGGRIRPLPRE